MADEPSRGAAGSGGARSSAICAKPQSADAELRKRRRCLAKPRSSIAQAIDDFVDLRVGQPGACGEEHLANVSFPLESLGMPDIAQWGFAGNQHLPRRVEDGAKRNALSFVAGQPVGHFRSVKIAPVVDLQEHVVLREQRLLVIEPPRQPETGVTIALTDADPD